MSERFLEGYRVDEPALRALIGTPKLAPKAIRAKANKQTTSDVDMTFGEAAVTDRALTALATNKLKSASAYELSRVLTLVLEAHGKKLGTIEMPYIESDSFGLLNPIAKALGLKTVAKEYGVHSFAFPFAKPQKVTWPIVMKVDAERWQQELAGDWKLRLEKLPDALFADPKYGLDDDRMTDAREQLPDVFGKLTTWAKATAKADQTLVLILDGDQ